MNLQGHRKDNDHIHHDQQQQPQQQEFIVGEKYRLSNDILAKGTFSEIRLAENMATGEKVAAKIKCKNNPSTLQIEYEVYLKLEPKFGFAQAYYYGEWGQKYNVLILKLLGKNLEQMFNICKRQFSLKTILAITIQLIDRFHYIHKKGIVYRNVKPENFLLGLKNDSKIIHVIDFGLSKSYLDSISGMHVDMQICNHFKGAIRYMSINAHQGLEQSRRDDLESIGYFIIYLLRQGKLPWSGLMPKEKTTTNGSTNIVVSKDMLQKIFEYKISIPIETLCYGFPIEFANFLRYSRTLAFKEDPDYQYLKRMFIELFKRENFVNDGRFDWTFA